MKMKGIKLNYIILILTFISVLALVCNNRNKPSFKAEYIDIEDVKLNCGSGTNTRILFNRLEQ